MEVKETFHPKSRADWRDWLSENFLQNKEIWLVFPRDQSVMNYNDMAEEALCFGWIDSTQKKLDEHFTALRFSPRRKNTTHSQLNVERLRLLLEIGLIHPSVLLDAKSIVEQKFIFPPDIMEEIRSNPEVWANFQAMPDGYKRMRIASIENARDNSELFRKRLDKFILKTRQNQLILGISGSDKYY